MSSSDCHMGAHRRNSRCPSIASRCSRIWGPLVSGSRWGAKESPTLAWVSFEGPSSEMLFGSAPEMDRGGYGSTFSLPLPTQSRPPVSINICPLQPTGIRETHVRFSCSSLCTCLYSTPLATTVYPCDESRTLNSAPQLPALRTAVGVRATIHGKLLPDTSTEAMYLDPGLLVILVIGAQ
ncbi:hypothetical protein BDFG_05026 [Blastomyces dermatitidis ATCC 26199]|nr:hypothetical protein BDFG_05026 [Blastomyces dermatitidis ATCC 26199]